MNNKVVLLTAVIASILVVGMISPIGVVFAHVNVCSSSNDHENDGTPFSALWAAVCDLQSQIDSLQNQINNLHGGGGTSNSYIQVSLNSTGNCIQTPSGYTYGWCTDNAQNQFIINDPAVNLGSVIVTSTAAPHHANELVQCPVTSINVVDGTYSGFLIKCDNAVFTDTVLNYIIVNSPTSNTCTPPKVLQNGVCVTPPVTCTPPQVLQNGVCVTPPVTCTPPKVLDKTTNTCVTPTSHDDDKDKKQSNDYQFSNYKNENRH